MSMKTKSEQNAFMWCNTTQRTMLTIDEKMTRKPTRMMLTITEGASQVAEEGVANCGRGDDDTDVTFRSKPPHSPARAFMALHNGSVLNRRYRRLQ